MTIIEQYRYRQNKNNYKKRYTEKMNLIPQYRFIKGPIPVWWVSQANRLAPCALKIGLVIWYICGLRKSERIVLSTKKCEEFNLDRKTKYRGLTLLESEGLVKVERRAKQNPYVTIIKTPPNDNPAD